MLVALRRYAPCRSQNDEPDKRVERGSRIQKIVWQISVNSYRGCRGVAIANNIHGCGWAVLAAEERLEAKIFAGGFGPLWWR